MSTTSFEELVDRSRERKRKEGQPAETVQSLAERCGVSRPFFYFLMAGSRTASKPTVERIAKVLGYSVRTVQKALRVSRGG